MTIVDRKFLREQRNLTMTFIRRYDRMMGGRGKPRRYDLDVVDAFLRQYFREAPAAPDYKRFSDDIFTTIYKYRDGDDGITGMSKLMVGRGGNG